MEPISARERIPEIDILRGFALFGVLAANMAAFGWPFALIASNPRYWHGPADRLAQALIEFFVSGKFVSLFSFLFGLGLAVQMERAEARGERVAPLFSRRLAVLLLIGWTHALLLWFGDILAPYALFGFLLLLFRNRKPKTLIAWTLIGMVLPLALMAGYLLVGPKDKADPAESKAMIDQAIRAYQQGSLGDILTIRLAELKMLYSFLPFFATRFFTMFLLGLWAGRRGIFRDVAGYAAFLRKVMAWGLAVGATSHVAGLVINEAFRPRFTQLNWLGLALNAVFTFGAPALSLFYASAILLLVQQESWRRRLAPLAAIGRMPLTNYLLESVVATTIFYSYGLGWYGKVGPAWGLGLAVAIYLLQIPLSGWWLKRFQFGPAEWIWRSLTYGKAQPMRLTRPATAGA